MYASLCNDESVYLWWWWCVHIFLHRLSSKGAWLDTGSEVAQRLEGTQLLARVGAREPLVCEALCCSGAVERVEDEHLCNEVLGLGRDVLPAAVVEGEAAGENLVKEFLLRVAVERKEAAEKHVEDDAKTPDVAVVVVDALLEHLWRNVARRPAARGHRALARGRVFREPEICLQKKKGSGE